MLNILDYLPCLCKQSLLWGIKFSFVIRFQKLLLHILQQIQDLILARNFFDHIIHKFKIKIIPEKSFSGESFSTLVCIKLVGYSNFLDGIFSLIFYHQVEDFEALLAGKEPPGRPVETQTSSGGQQPQESKACSMQ